QLATIKSESRLKHLLQRLPGYCPESMVSRQQEHAHTHTHERVGSEGDCLSSRMTSGPASTPHSQAFPGSRRAGWAWAAVSSPSPPSVAENADSGLHLLQLCGTPHHLSRVLPGHLPDGLHPHLVPDHCRHRVLPEPQRPAARLRRQLHQVLPRPQPHRQSALLRPGGGHPLPGGLSANPSHHEHGARDHGGPDPGVWLAATPPGPHVAVFPGQRTPSLPARGGDPPSGQDGLRQAALLLQGQHLALQVGRRRRREEGRPWSEPPRPLRRDMCQEVSTKWGSQTWQDFDQLCEYNPVETELTECLADVREPCQLGCKGLSYCTNFNNSLNGGAGGAWLPATVGSMRTAPQTPKQESRPTELFRSCNVQSDQGAMSDFKLWSNGTIKMPYMNIPVLDIRKCLPDMWKAVACSLQIKPCHIKSRGSLICKSDCVDILTQCGDRRRFHEGQTPERICELLSPVDDPERCIPLHRYLGPSVLDSDRAEEVVHPCNPNPCPSNHVCQVNRRGCLDALRCQPYICVPGCKLGEASDFLVQLDARVQVPTRTGPAGCYEVCSCGPSGRLENCVEMPCLDIHKPCVVGGQRRSPGSTFRVDCRLCSCLAGDSVCSRRRCLGSEGAQPQHLTGLPCDCPDRFVPVCASNGRNYPSACVARCLGFQDHQFVFGTCGMGNTCSSKPCPRNQRSVPP
ncbi:unnamed protein product, partial [Tetraodon nigroviridis]